MNTLLVFVVVILAIQIALFILGRRIKKKQRENDILYKYQINSRQDLWKTLSKPDLPEEDRQKLQTIYDEKEED